MPFRAAANGSLSAASAMLVIEAPDRRKPARRMMIVSVLNLTSGKIILRVFACQRRIARPSRSRNAEHLVSVMRALGRGAYFQSVLFGRRFALSAQPHSLSLSSSKKGGEGRGEEAILSIPPLSGSLPARSSQGERGKTPQTLYVPNTIEFQSALSPNCIRQSVARVLRAFAARNASQSATLRYSPGLFNLSGA